MDRHRLPPPHQRPTTRTHILPLCLTTPARTGEPNVPAQPEETVSRIRRTTAPDLVDAVDAVGPRLVHRRPCRAETRGEAGTVGKETDDDGYRRQVVGGSTDAVGA